MRQVEHDGADVPVLIVTHATSREALDGALTEIEALELLAGVQVFQAAAGGIGGAEGASRLICRGTREQVQKALEIVGSIQGEPPFIE